MADRLSPSPYCGVIIVIAQSIDTNVNCNCYVVYLDRDCHVLFFFRFMCNNRQHLFSEDNYHEATPYDDSTMKTDN